MPCNHVKDFFHFFRLLTPDRQRSYYRVIKEVHDVANLEVGNRTAQEASDGMAKEFFTETDQVYAGTSATVTDDKSEVL